MRGCNEDARYDESHGRKSSDSSRIVFGPKFEMKSLIRWKEVDGRMEREDWCCSNK